MKGITLHLALRIFLLLPFTIMEAFFAYQVDAAAITLWDLELDKENKEISENDFNIWMAKKGFQPFRFFLFTRKPKYWRLASCLNNENICLVMEDHKSSSHILTELENPIPLSDNLKLVMEFMVETWPKQTNLVKKDEEDAAIRIFLTADMDGRKVHLGLTVTRDHKAGQIMPSQRRPEEIKYMAIGINTTEEKVWQRVSAPIAALFQKAFGPLEKSEILAIGIKSDGNDTGSDVKAWIRELKLDLR